MQILVNGIGLTYIENGGYVTQTTGTTTESFLLSPVPEPSIVVLFSVGAAGLLAYAWQSVGHRSPWQGTISQTSAWGRQFAA